MLEIASQYSASSPALFRASMASFVKNWGECSKSFRGAAFHKVATILLYSDNCHQRLHQRPGYWIEVLSQGQ